MIRAKRGVETRWAKCRRDPRRDRFARRRDEFSVVTGELAVRHLVVQVDLSVWWTLVNASQRTLCIRERIGRKAS